MNGELSRYWFEGGIDGRRVWWFDAEVRDRVQLNRFFSMTAATAYHWEDDTVDGETNGVDVECGFEFVRGDLSVDLTVEYDLLSFAGSRDHGFGVYLNVRRDLTHLLRGIEGGGDR